MKNKNIITLLLAACATVTALASYSPPGSPTYTASLVVSPTSGVEISDCRVVTIAGAPYYTQSTNSQIRVTNYYYANGNLNNIPIGEVIAMTDRSYFFEQSPSGGATSTTITGDGYDVFASPTYYLYTDDQTGAMHGYYGAFFLRGAVDGITPGVFWYKYVPIALVASNAKFVTAQGGQQLHSSSATSVNDWETLWACNSTGTIYERMVGRLESGDTIALRTTDASNPRYWICAEHGGANNVMADRTAAYDWEHYTISKVSGSGTINNSDGVSLLDHDASSPKYWTRGAGDSIYATGTSVGTDQTFYVVRL